MRLDLGSAGASMRSESTTIPVQGFIIVDQVLIAAHWRSRYRPRPSTPHPTETLIKTMRRPSKDSSHKLSADSQRLATFAQAIVQAASRLEERSWEHSLDTQLQKLLKTGHQETIDATLGSLFKED